jgi:hypothetical protein
VSAYNLGSNTGINRLREDVAAKTRAVQDLEDIEKLKKTPAYTRYFERRVLEELEKRREKVLHDRQLSKDELWEARLLYLAARDTATMMASEEAACRNVIGISDKES